MTTTYALGGHTVHRVGYGAMQLPGPGVFGPPRDHDEAVRVLRRAVELGVNHVDTSQFYGPDVSNQLIHEALHPYPPELAIVSKVGATRDDEGDWLVWHQPEQLRQGVEDNLRTLGTEQLAAVNLRLPNPGQPGIGDQDVPLDAQLEEMARLREEGKIAGIGISTATLDEVRHAHESVGLVTVQNAFSLATQDDAETIAYCLEQGIAYAPYFPLGSAIEQMPKVVDVPAVRTVAERIGATPSQVGLAWLLAYAENVLLIPGTSSVAHLEENVAAGDLVLSAEDLAELSA